MTQYSESNRYEEPKRFTAQDLRERTKRIAGPMLERVRDTTSRVRTKARENPRPYIYSAAAMIGGAFLLSFLVRNLWSRRRVEKFDSL